MRIIAPRSDTRQAPQRPQAPRPSLRLFRPARHTLLNFTIDEIARTLLVLERAQRCAEAPAGAPCSCFAPLRAWEGRS